MPLALVVMVWRMLMAIQTTPSVCDFAFGANVDGLFNNVMGFDAMADNVSGAGNVASR